MAKAKVLLIERGRVLEAHGRYKVSFCPVCSKFRLWYRINNTVPARTGSYDWCLLEKGTKLDRKPKNVLITPGRHVAVFHRIHVDDRGQGRYFMNGDGIYVLRIGDESENVPDIVDSECKDCFRDRVKRNGFQVSKCLWLQKVDRGRLSIHSPGVEVRKEVGPHKLQGCQALVRNDFITIVVPKKGKIEGHQLDAGLYDCVHEKC